MAQIQSFRTFLLAGLGTLAIVAGAALPGCGPGEEGCGECFRAVSCVETCGGTVVQIGCCPCPTGTFDDLVCNQDAGTDGGDGG